MASPRDIAPYEDDARRQRLILAELERTMADDDRDFDGDALSDSSWGAGDFESAEIAEQPFCRWGKRARAQQGVAYGCSYGTTPGVRALCKQDKRGNCVESFNHFVSGKDIFERARNCALYVGDVVAADRDHCARVLRRIDAEVARVSKHVLTVRNK